MMSIETYLTDKMVINTKELSELLGRTPRTLLRWQDTEAYENPMPRPFSVGRGSHSCYDADKILQWYKTLPLKARI